MKDSAVQNVLSLIWWNAYDFYHFDADKKGKERWPNSLAAYEEKCTRVDKALTTLFKTTGLPTILSLGEITNRAAEDLQRRLLPDYKLISLDIKQDDPTLQVAIFYDPQIKNLAFKEMMPITILDAPRGTRAMAVLDLITNGNRLRCIVCHWPAAMDKTSERYRYRIADQLSKYTYEYLNEENRAERHHIIIIGDLNEEPFAENLETLYAHRHRGRAQGRAHWADADVKRSHLYNTSWRLLGERHPHPQSELVDLKNAAGTYYWADRGSWLTLDHIIVSGGLLETEKPYLNEADVGIACLPEFLEGEVPKKFTENNGKFSGLSDHLPIFAKIHI